MIFNSFNFLILYPLIFLGYYLIPFQWKRIRNVFLLLVSYALYMQFSPAFSLVLLYVTLVTFLAAKHLGYMHEENVSHNIEKGGKMKITLFIILTLLPLLAFKYYNFINEQFFALFSAIGVRVKLPGLNWAIPVGLSFYTFQAVGYLYDVYKKKIKAEEDFLDYALFLSFFPSVVSGPINKASLLMPQIKRERTYFDYATVVRGFRMLLWGMFMKVVVADRAGEYIDSVFVSYQSQSGLTCLFASLMYSVQIYADFAGYSLMAIGVGRTLGFELAENFRRPYFAVSVTDFWHRWHISLSVWLRDYIYIPLGGSRCSQLRNYVNIMITFLVSGIWHGANWTFVVWGSLHGLFQVIEKWLGQQKCEYGAMGKTVKIAVTFVLVSFAWLFFRMPELSDAFDVLARIFDTGSMDVIDLSDGKRMLLGLFVLMVKDVSDEFFPKSFTKTFGKYSIVRWTIYVSLIVIIMLLGNLGTGQFIYSIF